MLPIRHIALPLLDAFLSSHLSPCTRKEYARDIRDWLAHTDVIPIERITVMHLTAYREGMVKRGLSPGTINRHISTIRSYFRFLRQHGVIDRDPSEFLKRYRGESYRPTPSFSECEAMRILDRAKDAPQSGALHSAMLHVLFYLGLRCSEVCSLTIDSLGSSDGVSTLSVTGKGNKTRIIPITGPVFDSIQAYLHTREVNACTSPLFQNQKGNRLSRSAITSMLKAACIRAEVEPRGVHSCRVTCITNALENGASTIQAQWLGGWATMQMVLRYDRSRQVLKNSAAYAVNYKRSQK